jgi:hypothetical protein
MFISLQNRGSTRGVTKENDEDGEDFDDMNEEIDVTMLNVDEENVEDDAVRGEHNDEDEDGDVDRDLFKDGAEDAFQSTPAALPRSDRLSPERSVVRDQTNKVDRMKAMMRNIMRE